MGEEESKGLGAFGDALRLPAAAAGELDRARQGLSGLPEQIAALRDLPASIEADMKRTAELIEACGKQLELLKGVSEAVVLQMKVMQAAIDQLERVSGLIGQATDPLRRMTGQGPEKG